jgi:hypothetical protein
MSKNICLILFSIFFVPLIFADNPGDSFEIINENNSITITGFKGDERNIQIPNNINSIPVTAIGIFAFNNLTGVIIPEGIVSIGNGAFSNNQLRSVVIPESVLSIGHIAFQSNFLEEVILPPRITSIGQMAFANNRLKNIVIPNKVTFIMDGAFADNRFTEIIIPDSVTEIGNGAFENNPLVKIAIGAGVELFGGVYPFEESFCVFYTSNGRKKGTYIKNNGIWELSGEKNVTTEDQL